MHDTTSVDVQQVAACLRSEKLREFRAHLFCGAACSCEACAGVHHRDEHAPWPGSLTPCRIPTRWERCLGTHTSVSTLPRCRTRTPREATHWPASSVTTLPGCKTPSPLLQLHRTIHTLKIWILYCDSPQTFSTWPFLCTTCYLEIVKLCVFFIFLKHGCALLFPPSLIWLLLVSPSPSSLGPFFPRGGRSWGETMIKKQVSDLMLSE